MFKRIFITYGLGRYFDLEELQFLICKMGDNNAYLKTVVKVK